MRNQFHSPEKIQLEKRMLADEGGKIIDQAFREKRALKLSERRRLQNIHQQIENADSHLPAPDSRRAGQEDIGTERIERRSGDEQSNGNVALDVYLRGGRLGLASQINSEIDRRWSDFTPLEQRAITTSDAIATVPESVDAQIVTALQDFSGILNVCRIDRTDTAAPKKYPSASDLDNDGEVRAENDTVSGDAANSEQDPDFSPSIVLGGFSVDSGFLKLTVEETLDSAVDVVGTVMRFITERVGRKIANLLTGGAGTTEPLGIRNCATIGPTSSVGHPSDFLYSNLVSCVHSVDLAYRRQKSCGWLLSDGALEKLHLMVDTNQRPLLSPSTSGIEAGSPQMLLGFPIQPDSTLPTPAASSKSVLFGAMDRFVVRLAGPLRIQRLTERFADRQQIGFIGTQRVDAALIDTRAIKYLLQAAS